MIPGLRNPPDNGSFCENLHHQRLSARRIAGALAGERVCRITDCSRQKPRTCFT